MLPLPFGAHLAGTETPKQVRAAPYKGGPALGFGPGKAKPFRRFRRSFKGGFGGFAWTALTIELRSFGNGFEAAKPVSDYWRKSLECR
jgi:hypothetical protein